MQRKVRILLTKLSLAGLVCGLSVAPLALDGQSTNAGAQATGATTDAAAQRAGTPRQGFVLQAQTNVVLVDVRVTAKGKLVTDLDAKDFRVFEDGVPQTINSFSLENVEKLAQASSTNSPPPTINLDKLPPNVAPAKVLQDHRLTLLFFDVSSMQPDDLMRAIKAATTFVKQRLTPADLVSVVTYTSNLRVVQNFTNDRDALTKAINGILVGEESTNLAANGTVGEAGTTDALGQEVVTQDMSDAFTPDETEFNIFNTDEKLAAIQSLADMLRGVPGRKLVIHFSSGITGTGIENQAQLLATVAAANQSNVSLYTMDTRGLMALPPGGDATASSPAGSAVYRDAAVTSQIASMHSSRETLASLAQDTGGRTFYDTNDFGEAFQEIQSENSSYYLLGYSPTNTRSDGRFRKIRVEVDRPGVKVEARPGYYAPKNFRQFTREDKEAQLQQAINLDEPFLDLPFVVDTSYFLRPDNNYYVVLAAKIPGSAVQLLKKSNNHETEFDFIWRVTDPPGKPAGVLRDTLPVKLSGESYDMLLAGNFLYEGGLVLPSGKFQLKVLVRENQSGKMGTFEEPFVLPPVRTGGLALSSVVLSNEVKGDEAKEGRRAKSTGESDNPLKLEGKSVLPSVTNVFRTNQDLFVLLQSYSGKPASKANAPSAANAASVPPSVALAFFRHGAKVADAGPFPGKVGKSPDGKASYFVQIPLAKFHPGRYTLQVNVLDPANERVAFARVPMAVVPPPARPVASGG
jgi:VWFA-related protein